MIHPKEKILIVDDEELIRNLVCLMLSKLGYEPTSARHAVEALKFIQSVNGFQLVLTDLNMPQIDGWELALRIKVLKPRLPIVALTGESPVSILPQLKGSGIDHALFKPISMDLLGGALSDILDFPGDKEATECLGRGDGDLRFNSL